MIPNALVLFAFCGIIEATGLVACRLNQLVIKNEPSRYNQSLGTCFMFSFIVKHDLLFSKIITLLKIIP